MPNRLHLQLWSRISGLMLVKNWKRLYIVMCQGSAVSRKNTSRAHRRMPLRETLVCRWTIVSAWHITSTSSPNATMRCTSGTNLYLCVFHHTHEWDESHLIKTYFVIALYPCYQGNLFKSALNWLSFQKNSHKVANLSVRIDWGINCCCIPFPADP